MYYVGQLSGWDMILGKTALQDVRATTSAGTAPFTIQPPGMDRFSLRVMDHQVLVLFLFSYLCYYFHIITIKSQYCNSLS